MDSLHKRCLGCTMEYQGTACPACGYDPAKAPIQINYLAPGVLLDGRFLVGKVTASDPEGVWYVGFDQQEQVRVWVREYAPKNLTLRDYDSGYLQTLPGCGAQYKALMSDFEDLCDTIRGLPKSEHVMPIDHMVRQNNTLYAIYRYTRMITLEAFLRRSGGKLPWRHAKKLLMPLLHTMSHVHNAGLIHRGLSPRTVELDQSGNLWVSCFTISAARTNKSELNALLYEGYAAPEQYASDGWQGTWTDVYALGAIFYRTLMGRDPISARDRVFGDDLLDRLDLVPDMSESVMNAINHALTTEVDERTKTPEIFIAELLDSGGSNTTVYTAQPVKTRVAAVHIVEDEESPAAVPPARTAAAPRTAAALPAVDNRGLAKEAEHASAARKGSARKKRSKSHRKQRSHPILLSIFITFLGILVIGGGLYWFANNFLTDLFRLPGQSGSSSGAVAPASSGQNFSQTVEEEASGKLPLFVGTTLDSIQANAVMQRRYSFKIEESYNNDFAVGTVFDQQPIEGTEVPQGGEVVLFVSKGVETVEMPEIVGKPVAEAEALMQELEIPYQIIKVYNQTYEPDVIVRADREPGTRIDKNRDTVLLYIKQTDISSSSSRSSSQSSTGRLGAQRNKNSSSSQSSSSYSSLRLVRP